MSKLLYISILLLVISSCTSKEQTLTKKEYVQWVQNPQNGLRKKKDISDYHFEVIHKTPEYMSIQGVKNIDPEMESYELQIASNNPSVTAMDLGVTDMGQYQDKVNYFAFDFQRDIRLVVDGDSIYPTHFHFERTYDIKPYVSFDIAFKKQDLEKERTIYINGTRLGVGPLKFKFKDIKNTPKLKID